MPRYTIDAHPLIWHFTNSPKLSPKAKEYIDEIEQGKSTGIIPTIVMAESFYVANKKRINFDYNDLLDKIILSPNYLLYPLAKGYVSESCKNKRQRHQLIEDFMLINDSSTIRIKILLSACVFTNFDEKH